MQRPSKRQLHFHHLIWFGCPSGEFRNPTPCLGTLCLRGCLEFVSLWYGLITFTVFLSRSSVITSSSLTLSCSTGWETPKLPYMPELIVCDKVVTFRCCGMCRSSKEHTFSVTWSLSGSGQAGAGQAGIVQTAFPLHSANSVPFPFAIPYAALICRSEAQSCSAASVMVLYIGDKSLTSYLCHFFNLRYTVFIFKALLFPRAIKWLNTH